MAKSVLIYPRDSHAFANAIGIGPTNLENHHISSFAFSNPDDKKVLAELAASKNVIGIFVRGKYGFWDDLQGLQEGKPEDAGLVAVVPKPLYFKKEKFEHNFDLIIYYDVVVYQTFVRKVLFPNLRGVVDEIVNIVPKEKIRLIHTDQLSMTEVGLSRQQHGLKGAYPEDIDRLCRKDRVAQIAQKAGIPTAKTVFLDFTKPHSYDELLGKIQKEIGIFPMFAKPNRMAGSIGIAKIENMEELEKWLGDRLGDAVPMPYVIQEFIKGNEFGIVVLLLPDGSWKPLVVHLFHGTTFQEAFLKGKPLIVAAETLEDAVNGPLPKLDTFTQKVIDAFNPVQPQIFFVQGFQLSPGTDQYVFNEINYRPCGDRVNAVLYETCGIKLYTALALAHIVPNYRPIPDSQWNPQIASLVFYAFQKGILQSHNHALLTANVKSRIEVEWLKNPGDQIQEPVKIANALVRFKLYSKSKEERDADLEWIRENWNPDVAKNLV